MIFIQIWETIVFLFPIILFIGVGIGVLFIIQWLNEHIDW